MSVLLQIISFEKTMEILLVGCHVQGWPHSYSLAVFAQIAANSFADRLARRGQFVSSLQPGLPSHRPWFSPIFSDMSRMLSLMLKSHSFNVKLWLAQSWGKLLDSLSQNRHLMSQNLFMFQLVRDWEQQEKSSIGKASDHFLHRIS